MTYQRDTIKASDVFCFFILEKDMDAYLSGVYYNPKRTGGFGGVERLYNDVKKDGKFDVSRAQIRKWLMGQDTYTLHKPARRRFQTESRHCWRY